jgi:hypothetical protein
VGAGEGRYFVAIIASMQFACMQCHRHYSIIYHAQALSQNLSRLIDSATKPIDITPPSFENQSSRLTNVLFQSVK